MEISSRLEGLLAKACALNRSNKVKVYGVGSSLYLLNFDRTLMMKFCWEGKERFQPSVGFALSDYAGGSLEVKDGMVRFSSEKGGWVKEKWVRSDSVTPEEVDRVFSERKKEAESGACFSLGKDFLGLLDDGLSHVEFRMRHGRLEAIQRDVYAGSVILLHKKGEGFLSAGADAGAFDSVGVRTEDLKALFLFCDSYRVYVGSGALYLVGGKVRGVDVSGLMARCFYDEMKGEVYGREEPQVRVNK